MSHRTRIAALERRLALASTVLTLIRITGGLPEADAICATVGSEELEREVDETLQAFEARALAAARMAGQQFVIIGGLPD